MTELEVRVRGLRWEAQDVVSVELEALHGALPAWKPGAHLDLMLPGGAERQYSLCGDPASRHWRIAVLRETGGRGGSRWIHDELRPGQRVTVRGIRNHFELIDAPAYLFIAGGIGITPILPMLDQVDRAGREWQLVYGGRSRSSMAFLEQLARHGDRVHVAPEDEVGQLDLRRALTGSPSGAVVYCCGPGSLIDAVTALCDELGRCVHVERFRPVLDAATARAGDSFDVCLQRSGLRLTVRDGQSVLDAVEAAGLSVPCSCLEGICGTCETLVLEGEVDHRDSILTERERESGRTMMICVSRARSAWITLDL
jgi:ferredoxin-NADP reductase